jgi:electron transfer flavoprotein beta subunit
MKWVDSRPEVDPLSGAVHTDARTAGASPADEAALEWALRTTETVVALTAGPPGATAVLRLAVAAGAACGVRVDLDPAAPSDVVASALAAALPAEVDLVICGVWSLDRGSGSVPAFLAARLEAAQALGLLSVAFGGSGITAERRLDRGRRERLRVPRPAVLSVEGGSARLRRAPLSGVLAAGQAPIEVVAGPVVHVPPVRRYPFRPRPRVVPAPASADPRARILALTGALTDRTPPQRLTLDPSAAADRVLAQLSEWGFR